VLQLSVLEIDLYIADRQTVCLFRIFF